MLGETNSSIRRAGLVPGIHVLKVRRPERKTWLAGTSPAMTECWNHDGTV
jgi:hypothetical protein